MIRFHFSCLLTLKFTSNKLKSRGMLGGGHWPCPPPYRSPNFILHTGRPVEKLSCIAIHELPMSHGMYCLLVQRNSPSPNRLSLKKSANAVRFPEKYGLIFTVPFLFAVHDKQINGKLSGTSNTF